MSEVYTYLEKLNRMIMIRNSISLICFTALAIVFRHWWIVLFSLLFQSYIKTNSNKSKEGSEA